MPQLQARLLWPHKGNSEDAVAQLVLEPVLPHAQLAEPQARHCSELCLLGLHSPEEIDLPAKRMWEAKVFAPTRTAGRRFVLWSR